MKCWDCGAVLYYESERRVWVCLACGRWRSATCVAAAGLPVIVPPHDRVYVVNPEDTPGPGVFIDVQDLLEADRPLG